MFYRIYPQKDCFVTNYKVFERPREQANTGASEILCLFKMANAPQSGSRANILMKFDTAGYQIFSGSVFNLKLFNAEHGETLPYSYDVHIRPIEQQWDEGRGHDLDTYQDDGVANWLSASVGRPWTTPGAYPSGTTSVSFHFDTGEEDLDVDVTALIPSASNGLFVQFDPVLEADENDYYVKMFHSRQTHFETKKPHIEVRWADWTGSLSSASALVPDPAGEIVASLYDLKDVYRQSEMVTLHLYTRPKDWNPSVVHTGSSVPPGSVLTKAYYSIIDDCTEEVVVPFATGGLEYTRLSYNDQGNYFKIHMGSLPTGTIFRMEFLYQSGSDWMMLPGDDYKFRIK